MSELTIQFRRVDELTRLQSFLEDVIGAGIRWCGRGPPAHDFDRSRLEQIALVLDGVLACAPARLGAAIGTDERDERPAASAGRDERGPFVALKGDLRVVTGIVDRMSSTPIAHVA